jgi:hypothetical protein
VKVISVIEESVVLEKILNVDFTVCTCFEISILNTSILEGNTCN